MNEIAPTSDGEYAAFIHAHAEQLGFPISVDQLRHLRDEGVVTYLGSASNPDGGRGRTGLYAVGTAARVVEIRCRMVGSDLAATMWRMWLDGFEVDDRWTRDRILAAAKALDQTYVQVREKAFISSGAAFSDDLIDELEKHPRFAGPIAATRKLVGKRAFDTFLFRMLGIAFGREIPTKPDYGHTPEDIKFEERHLVGGLGFAQLPKDCADAKRRSSDSGVISILNKLARRLKGVVLAVEIERQSNAVLREAAIEIEAIKRNNRRLYTALNWLFGRHAFGRGHAARVVERYRPLDDLHVLILWSIARVDFSPQIKHELSPENTESVDAVAAEFANIKAIMQANPAFAEIVTPEIFKRLVANSKDQGEVIAKIQLMVFGKLLTLIRSRSQIRNG